MKTVREWLYTLPPKIRDRALEEAIKLPYNNLERMSPSLLDSLRGAFDWSNTREGWEFWSRIASGQAEVDRRWNIIGKLAFAAAVIMIIFMAASIQGCITIRESGAHDVTVNTNGNQNRFDLHTERQNSAQTAQAAASITPGINGDEAVKSAAKLAATLGTGGAAALPLAAAKIAEPDAQPLTLPLVAAKIAEDAKPLTGEPK
jgi:hypothetical protein